jgi:secreted Zn-dependent insulinase-like peptidase
MQLNSPCKPRGSQSITNGGLSAGIDVQQVMTEHCRAYCGAQNLLVVASGTQSLNKLEKMVKKTFGKIPRALKDAPDYSKMGLPFQGSFLPDLQQDGLGHLIFCRMDYITWFAAG